MKPERTLTFEQLLPGQRAVVQAVRDGENVLITGPAGTGKSAVLRFTRDEMPDLPVTASTGIAALNVGGCTLHSWAGMGLGKESAKTIASRLKDRRNSVWYGVKTAKALAIDEVSMIDAELFTKLNEIMQLVRGNALPFGGCQIIAIGDFCQLPPVGEDGKPCRFAFDCPAWEHANIRTFVLNEVVRQQDRAFAETLNRIRVGDAAEDVRQIIRPRVGALDPHPEIPAVELTTHNAIADKINAEHLAALPGKEHRWLASDYADTPALQAQLDRNCIAPKELVLRPGAAVMLLRNLDLDAGLANGSLGVVESIADDSKYGRRHPVVKFESGTVLEIEREEWQMMRGRDVIASRRQFPLRLAWAMSIHKSQGMTLSKVRLHLKHCFADGQAYVALSRCKTLEGMFIADISGNSIRANPVALEFYRQATHPTEAVA